LDYLLKDEDHIWIINYKKSAKSSLSDPRVYALLAKYLPPTFSIARTKAGRPFAQSSVGTCADFNIAHSHNLLTVAFSENLIGIDLEFIKARAHLDRISKRYFSNAEPHENLCDFYRSWTAREAYIKIKAQGLRTLVNIDIDSREQIWHVGEKNILDYRVEFNIWEEEYLIAVCRHATKLKKLSYFSLRL